MTMSRTTDRFAPDGVHIDIAWDRMRYNDSVFIPCINTARAKALVTEEGKRRGWRFLSVVTAENDLYGVRVWRIR